MHVLRPAIAVDPKLFGKGRTRLVENDVCPPLVKLGDDLKLFATTFLAGFVFVSILIG